LTQAWPWLAAPLRLGTIRATRPSWTSASSEQPTPQYAQVVVTAVDGRGALISDFSESAAVGQASTHAPHDTHSESMKRSLWLAETREARPRPSIVSARVPCVSSQARTQREQTMHSSGLKLKYGLLVSVAAGIPPITSNA
jgi:hypothetical protein